MQSFGIKRRKEPRGRARHLSDNERRALPLIASVRKLLDKVAMAAAIVASDMHCSYLRCERTSERSERGREGESEAPRIIELHRQVGVRGMKRAVLVRVRQAVIQHDEPLAAGLRYPMQPAVETS